MITLNADQWQTLQVQESRQFVAGVCDQFLAGRPEMLQNPGREAVLQYMQAAFDYATRTGFTDTPHVVQLMYLAADVPGFYEDPVVDRYLRKPGATPEQRLDDLKAVIMHKLKEMS